MRRLPVLTRLYADEAVIVPDLGNGTPIILLRDVALAMAVLLTNQSPKDYGFEVMQFAPGQPNFGYMNYRFRADPMLTAEEKRVAAFAKWRAWETEVHGSVAGPALPSATREPDKN